MILKVKMSIELFQLAASLRTKQAYRCLSRQDLLFFQMATQITRIIRCIREGQIGMQLWIGPTDTN